jgi:predicted nucleic acid-binding Zn ribbon protein
MRYPLPLYDVVQIELTSLGLAERLREAEIWRLWPEVVGQTVAARATPLRIIKGTLTVAVSSGPWKQELTFLKSMMIEKLNERLGGEVVREIILKSGQVGRDSVISLPPEEIPSKKRLTTRQLSLIDEQSAAIANLETREAFVALMKASFENTR